jgi:predicted ATPase/DNA-binding SARP family transcriptional activator
MELRVLGPIEVIGEDGPVRLPAPMHRRLLAALVVAGGETRSTDALIDALWAESPPTSAPKLVQIYVSQLRKAVPAPARIETRNAGYALEVDGQLLDAARFEHLLGEGRAALRDRNPVLALSLLRRAVELWRGDAYAEFSYDDFARTEAERLEELRRVAIEERIEASLELGRHEEVLADVTSLAGAHPLRERLHAQAMLALYRCGRQSEALEVYSRVRARLRDELGLEPGLELRDLQRRILRHDPSLLAAGCEDEARAALPIPPNELRGRTRELGELRRLLIGDDVRLLVLTGAGGSGKTRLAMEAARESASSFANGAVFVSLASLQDPDLVVGEISRVLGVRGTGSLESLVEALRARELLLVLDNAEQVRAAAPAFVELLARAPRVTLLVTSRVVLHISGEYVYPIEPLDEDTAAALFVERAHSADSRFSPGEDDLDEIRRVCARLDGLPLAVELAASRIRTLSPAELRARLDVRLPLLTGGPRDLPARQQTLRATLEWSAELLGDEEIRDLTHLAVFAGGWTLAAAEAVCGATADRLASLIDHSLVTRTATGGYSRYSMLETIREYAAGRLEQDAGAAARRRHAEYFCGLGEQAEAELEGAGQATWLDALDRDHDNLRAALEWCFSLGDPTLGARLAVSLWRFWYFRGHAVEGRGWLKRALTADFGQDATLEGKLLKAGAILARELGDLDAMRVQTRRRLALARARNDTSEIAGCLNNLGLIALVQGHDRKAEKLFCESVSLWRALGDDAPPRVGIDVPLGNLSFVALRAKDLERAETLASESLAVAEGRGDAEQIIAMLQAISLIRIEQDRFADAVAHQRDAIRLADPLDSKAIFSDCCVPLVIVLARTGQLERAAQVLGRREALRDELGQPPAWFDGRILAGTDELLRRGLGDTKADQAMEVGARTDVRALLEAALEDAAAAASRGGALAT